MNFNNMNEWHHTVVAPRTPNVVFATHVQNLEGVRANGFLDDLPNKLNKDILLTALAAAKQRPDWKFFITHNGSSLSTSCYVSHEGELLGALSLEQFCNLRNYTMDVRMTLTSPSIRSAAQRKNHVASTDKKRILRMLLAECRPTPPEKQATNRANHAATIANQLINEATTYSVDSNINPTVLHAFLQELGLWDAYTRAAIAKGAKPDFGAEIERRTAFKVVGDTLAAAKASDKLIVATATDDGYYVFGMNSSRGLSSDEPLQLSNSDLTDSMRTKLGMLKLADHNTLVPNVGMRTNEDDNCYVLVAED